MWFKDRRRSPRFACRGRADNGADLLHPIADEPMRMSGEIPRDWSDFRAPFGEVAATFFAAGVFAAFLAPFAATCFRATFFALAAGFFSAAFLQPNAAWLHRPSSSVTLH